MTKHVPQRYDPRRGKRYVKPVRVVPGQKPRRGQLERPFTPPWKTLDHLRITFHPDGQVTVPRYKRVPGTDKLVVERYVTFKNPPAAIRAVANQMSSIKGEAAALNLLSRQLTGLHADGVQNWNRYDASQRATFKNLLASYAGAIGDVKQLTREYKRKALLGLQRGEELLEAGNISAGAAKIIGVANDLVAQENEFIRQRSYLPRRGIVLHQTSKIYRERLEKYVTDMLTRMDRLRAPFLRRQDIGPILDEMRKDYVSMTSKHENEVKGALGDLAIAGKAVRAGEFDKARTYMRNVNRQIVRALSRRYILSPRLLSIAQHSAFPEHRRAVFKEQLEMLSDNLSYWYHNVKAPLTTTSVAEHLNAFVRAAQNDLPAESMALVNQAAEAVRAGMPTIAIEKIEQAHALVSKAV